MKKNRLLKHILKMTLSVLMLLLFTVPVFAATEIGTAEELEKIRENPEGNYILTGDIDLAGTAWEPLNFSGTLDGNGHTIRNISVTELTTETRTTVDGNSKEYETFFGGFFGILENATVKNLNIRGLTVSVDREFSTGDNMQGVFLGGLAGYAGNATVENVTVAERIELATNAKNNGVGGFFGFAKASVIRDSDVSSVLVLTDTDKTVRDENFLGGAYGAGYASVIDSRVDLRGYDSCHGYVHSGGLVGMYFPFGYSYNDAPYYDFTGNTITGGITFFEDNQNRRAYCEETIGEVMNWNINRSGNTFKGFEKNEVFEYDVNLTPENTDREVSVNYTSCTEYAAGSSLTIRGTGDEELSGVYVILWEPASGVTMTKTEGAGDIGETYEADSEYGEFLQYYVDFSGTVSEDTGVTENADASLTGDLYPVSHDVALESSYGRTKLSGASEICITFQDGAKVCGIYAVTKADLTANGGELPEWVHDWDAPCEEADILLMSTHADDEQLFFAGILPYYAEVRGLDVQVVYFTSHNSELKRHQERLNGLWTVGIRHYPACLEVPDAWADTYDQALSNAEKAGISEETLENLVRDVITRFRPKVIIGHDEQGEYKHGQHMLNTTTLEKVLNGTAANGAGEETTAENITGGNKATENKTGGETTETGANVENTSGGTWAESQDYLERVYLHLYETNPITLSFLDTAYDELDGKTPFQVTQDGFQYHQSQMWTWFKGWIYGKTETITKASQIKTYSPLYYGLYYAKDLNRTGQETSSTTDGTDANGSDTTAGGTGTGGNGSGETPVSGAGTTNSGPANSETAAAGKTLSELAAEQGDFFYGLTSYAEERAEEERLRAEEEARIAAEEAAEEAERLAQENAAKEKRAKAGTVIRKVLLILVGIVAFLAVLVLVLRFINHRRYAKKRGKHRKN